MDISYSDGRVVKNVVADIWEDLHTARSGYFRAFWVADPQNVTTGSPAIGYCSPGGSHRTIRAVAAEVREYYPGVDVYRNGRKVS